MSNGIEQDVRDIRKDVQDIATRGCAHKEAHEKSIGELWTAIATEQKERSAMFIKITLLLLTITLTGVFASYYATSSAVEAAVSKAIAMQAAMPKK